MAETDFTKKLWQNLNTYARSKSASWQQAICQQIASMLDAC
jgi:hypothetical protein